MHYCAISFIFIYNLNYIIIIYFLRKHTDEYAIIINKL